MTNWPTRTAHVQIPASVSRNWLLKQKLRENEEKLLSLDVGPMLQLQYTMAMTGIRHVWDPEQGKPVPKKVQIRQYDADGVPMSDANGKPLYDEQDESLPAQEQNKLLEKLCDRILPAAKSIDRESLAKTVDAEAIGHTVEDLSQMTSAQLREFYAKLERADSEQKRLTQGADPAPASDVGDASVRPTDERT